MPTPVAAEPTRSAMRPALPPATSETGRRERLAAVVALAAALLPVAVMAARAVAERWVPLFDAAYYTVRSRDVATAHNPLVGTWSMGSRVIGVWINSLGPMMFQLLAPFTKTSPYAGTAIGIATLNGVAIVGVWVLARRMFGDRAAIGAMGATLLIELDIGSLMLIEARAQLALLLPLWLLLWLVAATVAGDRWALPWLVGVASLIVQSHFTYVYQTAALLVLAAVASAWHHRHDVGSLRRPLLASTAVAAVCWAAPLWDQFAGSGNLRAVLSQRGGSERSLGYARGVEIVAEAGLLPPFFAPGAIGEFLRDGDRPALPLAVLAVTLTLAAVAVAAWRGRGARRALAVTAVVALVGATHAAAVIPPTEQFGVVPQNYYWMWPIGIFAGTALVAGSAPWVAGRLEAVRSARFGASPTGLSGALSIAGAVLCCLAALVLLAPRNPIPETAHEWDVSRRAARPLLDQFAVALAQFPDDAVVAVDLGSNDHVRYTLLAELQRRGIEFRFAAGTTDLSRFGIARCDDGTANVQLRLHHGAAALALADAPDVIAAVDPEPVDQRHERVMFAGRVAAAIDGGLITVDEQTVIDTGGTLPAAWSAVLAGEAADATGLSDFIVGYAFYDIVTIDESLTDDVHRWARLEDQRDLAAMAITAEPISSARPDWCGVYRPGELARLELSHPRARQAGDDAVSA